MITLPASLRSLAHQIAKARLLASSIRVLPMFELGMSCTLDPWQLATHRRCPKFRDFRDRRLDHRELRPEELVQPPGNQLAPVVEECLVCIDAQQGHVGRDALSLERRRARLLDHWREVLARRFVADLAVGLPGYEAEVGDIIG